MATPTEDDVESAAIEAAEDAAEAFEQFMTDWDHAKVRKFQHELFVAIYNFTEAYFP